MKVIEHAHKLTKTLKANYKIIGFFSLIHITPDRQTSYVITRTMAKSNINLRICPKRDHWENSKIKGKKTKQSKNRQHRTKLAIDTYSYSK